MTVSDGLRVRSQPWVGDESMKYEPLLPLGTELQVLAGPVSASGYDWYKVSPISFTGLEGPGFGWVAAAGQDAEPWIALVETPVAGMEFTAADCPPVPADVGALQSLPSGARVACFSRLPITVRARIVSCRCDITPGGSLEPSWFGSSFVTSNNSTARSVSAAAMGSHDIGPAILGGCSGDWPDPLKTCFEAATAKIPGETDRLFTAIAGLVPTGAKVLGLAPGRPVAGSWRPPAAAVRDGADDQDESDGG